MSQGGNAVRTVQDYGGLCPRESDKSRDGTGLGVFEEQKEACVSGG